MPTYSAKCEECGQVRDYVAKVDSRDQTPQCHGPMVRQLAAPMIQGSSCVDVSYKCPMTGEVVKSLKRRQYLMEANNVVDSRELQDTWAKKRIKDAQEKEDLRKYNESIPDAVKKAFAESAPVATAT